MLLIIYIFISIWFLSSFISNEFFNSEKLLEELPSEKELTYIIQKERLINKIIKGCLWSYCFVVILMYI